MSEAKEDMNEPIIYFSYDFLYLITYSYVDKFHLFQRHAPLSEVPPPLRSEEKCKPQTSRDCPQAFNKVTCPYPMTNCKRPPLRKNDDIEMYELSARQVYTMEYSIKNEMHEYNMCLYCVCYIKVHNIEKRKCIKTIQKTAQNTPSYFRILSIHDQTL